MNRLLLLIFEVTFLIYFSSDPKTKGEKKKKKKENS